MKIYIHITVHQEFHACPRWATAVVGNFEHSLVIEFTTNWIVVSNWSTTL